MVQVVEERLLLVGAGAWRQHEKVVDASLEQRSSDRHALCVSADLLPREQSDGTVGRLDCRGAAAVDDAEVVAERGQERCSIRVQREELRGCNRCAHGRRAHRRLAQQQREERVAHGGVDLSEPHWGARGALKQRLHARLDEAALRPRKRQLSHEPGATLLARSEEGLDQRVRAARWWSRARP